MSGNVLWYTTRGAGAVSEILLTCVVVLGVLSALRVRAGGLPRFVTTGFHRNLALMTLVFLTLHIITAIVDPFASLGLAALIPFTSYYRTFWLGLGAVSFELVLAVVVTSVLRGWLGRRLWRTTHWVTYAAWPVAVAHGLGTGTDAWSAWLLAITAACVAAVVLAVAWRVGANSRDPLASARLVYRRAVDRREAR